MSSNQFREQEQDKKKNFGKLTPEEQKEVSKKNPRQGTGEGPSTNEQLPEETQKKFQEDRARHTR